MCDERITLPLPLKAFSDFPEIYNNLSASLGQHAGVGGEDGLALQHGAVVDCPTQAGVRGPHLPQAWLRRELYEGARPGNLDTSAAFGAERIILDPSAAEQERSLPPITPDNVSSVASDDYKRKVARDKTAHVF